MDRRFLTVLVISLMFAAVVSGIFYQMSVRMSGRPKDAKPVSQSKVVVAATPLSVGIQIKRSDIKLVNMARDQAPSGSFEKIEDVVGRPVISNILAGEPVVAGRLADRGSGFGLSPTIPQGLRAVAVKVNEVVGVAGFLIPGVRVDVLVTVNPPGEENARTSTILQNVVIASAGQQIQPDSSGRAVNVTVVTLLVTPEQAETLTLAGTEGKVQLVLRNASDLAVGQTPGRRMAELYGPARPAAVPAKPAAAPRPAAAPKPAVVEAPPAPEEILVIRGSERKSEALRVTSPKK
jgi:pilus assembly protein CpaB